MYNFVCPLRGETAAGFRSEGFFLSLQQFLVGDFFRLPLSPASFCNPQLDIQRFEKGRPSMSRFSNRRPFYFFRLFTLILPFSQNAATSSQLHSPGPCCSLAGHLAFNADGASVQFTLAPGRDYQRRYFEPSTGCYQPLPAPWPLDCQFFTANMGVSLPPVLTFCVSKV